MRKFMTECKDDKTGLSMVLSECSYNMACDWLERTLAEYGVKISRVETVTQTNGKIVVIHSVDEEGVPCRRYYYDEERGYLLGE